MNKARYKCVCEDFHYFQKPRYSDDCNSEMQNKDMIDWTTDAPDIISQCIEKRNF